MHCCVSAASNSARAIFWARFNSRPIRTAGPLRAVSRRRAPSGEQLNQHLDPREQILLGAGIVREAEFERTVEPIVFRPALHQLQDALRVDLVLFLENDV